MYDSTPIDCGSRPAGELLFFSS